MKFIVTDPNNDKGNNICLVILGILAITFPFWGKALAAIVLGYPLSNVVWW